MSISPSGSVPVLRLINFFETASILQIYYYQIDLSCKLNIFPSQWLTVHVIPGSCKKQLLWSDQSLAQGHHCQLTEAGQTLINVPYQCPVLLDLGLEPVTFYRSVIESTEMSMSHHVLLKSIQSLQSLVCIHVSDWSKRKFIPLRLP